MALSSRRKLVPAAVRVELTGLLQHDPRQLGAVHRQVESGVTAPKDIVRAGAAKNTGAVSNLLQTRAAILNRSLPESATVARQAAAALGALIAANTVSGKTRTYLNSLRDDLYALARSEPALARDAALVDETDRELTQRARTLSGAYVYSFHTLLRYPDDPETGRCRLKVGSTNQGALKRVLEQTRQTGWPEDPKLLRIYHSPSLSPAEIETRLHAVLDAAGQPRVAATNPRAGTEWFSTTLELLDTIAEAMGLTVERSVHNDIS